MVAMVVCPAHGRLLLAMLAASCLPGFEAKSEHMSRGECLACVDACDGKYCPKVCAGKTAEGDDMTCALDNDCLDNAIDPYGGMGCNVRAGPNHENHETLLIPNPTPTPTPTLTQI